MGIGASIFLVAVGAILAFAVTADVQGIDIATVGWILMIVGIVGFLLSLLFWSTWGGVGTLAARNGRSPGSVQPASLLGTHLLLIRRRAAHAALRVCG